MGREVRRVPADWQHPKEWKFNHRGKFVEVYKPQSEGHEYQPAADEWDAKCAEWKAGHRPDYCDDESNLLTYEQWAGQRPHRDDYMPVWPDEQRTHLMMYESTSEGTPISPAFETPEALAQWLVDNKASSFGCGKGSYEFWLHLARNGRAPDMVVMMPKEEGK